MSCLFQSLKMYNNSIKCFEILEIVLPKVLIYLNVLLPLFHYMAKTISVCGFRVVWKKACSCGPILEWNCECRIWDLAFSCSFPWTTLNNQELHQIMAQFDQRGSRLLSTLDILFSSNHNIHKSSSGHCFWVSDPLIDRFY